MNREMEINVGKIGGMWESGRKGRTNERIKQG